MRFTTWTPSPGVGYLRAPGRHKESSHEDLHASCRTRPRRRRPGGRLRRVERREQWGLVLRRRQRSAAAWGQRRRRLVRRSRSRWTRRTSSTTSRSGSSSRSWSRSTRSAPNGKGVEPWLATVLHALARQADLDLPPAARGQVLQRQAHDLGRRQVLDRRRPARPPRAGATSTRPSRTSRTPNPETVVIHTKYPWAPFLADIALFANGIIPNNYGGETAKQFYTHPIGTGPFMWGHWTHGAEIAAQANPHYWQKGKPYLDQVTFKTVADTNTRAAAAAGRPGADRRVPRLADREHAQEPRRGSR